MTDGSNAEPRGWLAGRIPTGWFTGPPQVASDRDELLVTGELAPVELDPDASPVERAAAARSRAEAFREETRGQRMHIAEDAELRFRRKVSWAVRIGEETFPFTTLSVPVMTRLRLRERQVLDTLVDAGVARSRSDALAWCVRLVHDHQGDWIAQLRAALEGVEQARAAGPAPGAAGRGPSDAGEEGQTG